MPKFRNKYRIKSTRLVDWDYSTPWWYYVTICTKNHQCFFGEMKNGKSELNKLGLIVEKFWKKTPEHFKKVELDEYIIMPNHLHGIVIINDVETGHAPSLRNSLGNVIGGFKSAVTKWSHENGYIKFQWQARYYDHIIRNQKDLDRIRKYIQQNPLKWELDEYYKG